MCALGSIHILILPDQVNPPPKDAMERTTRKLIGPYGKTHGWNPATRRKVRKQVNRRIRRALRKVER